MGAGPLVELFDGFEHGDGPAINGHGHTRFKGDCELVGGVAQARVLGVCVEVLGGRVPQVFEETGFHGTTPHVLVDAEWGLFRLFDGKVDFLGKGDGLVPGPGVVAGGGNDFQLGGQAAEPDFEADLIVALAGAAVGDVSAAELLGGLHQMLHNERPGNGGDQRVLLHVHAVGPNCGQAVVISEFVFHVDDDGFDGTTIEGTLAHGFHVLAALTQVEGNGNDFTTGHFRQVWDSNGGVKATGICEDYTVGHNVIFLLIERSVSRRVPCPSMGRGPGQTRYRHRR